MTNTELRKIARGGDTGHPITSNEAQALLAKIRPLTPRAGVWHRAPDGTSCRCTAEDRRFGCGCR